ncbi:MAG: nitroreductase family protein [Microthrixaceae bacterium]
MTLGLSADEVLNTTRAVRKRLDFDRPVDPILIKECLEAAIQAPSGSNTQTWQWVVVTDEGQRRALAELYKSGWEVYANSDMAASRAAGDVDPERQAQQDRVMGSAEHLAQNFERVPVMVIPVVPARLDGFPSAVAATYFGSILPAAWSFMLAARERGLGTAWTSIHLFQEQKAAEILGLDYEQTTQCALITCGHTLGTDFKPATRPPIEDVLHWDRKDGKAPWE